MISASLTNMHKTFFSRLKSKTATEFSHELMTTLHILEAAVLEADSQFKSPLTSGSLRTWGEYAHERVIIHPRYAQLEQWYEALKILVVSWEEGDDAAVMFLKMMTADKSSVWPKSAEEAISCFSATKPSTYRRFEHLCEVLLEKIRSAEKFRGILFVEQRVMTHVLNYYLQHHSQLAPLVRSKCLHATNEPATASLQFSKRDSKESLRAFRTGEANLLIATSVAEEGLDIAEANTVIRFDSMNNAVSCARPRPRAPVGRQFRRAQRTSGPPCHPSRAARA